jgi:hypothetical protein
MTTIGFEVEEPRDQKGYTWVPIDEYAKKDRTWIPVEDLTTMKKKELNWIPIGD